MSPEKPVLYSEYDQYERITRRMMSQADVARYVCLNPLAELHNGIVRAAYRSQTSEL